MNEHAKGGAMVLGPEDGEALWQPLPSTGYIINKLNPYNSPYDSFATGIQVLEPGTHVRRHAHERSHEVLFCYRGSGYVEIETERHELTEETMVLVGRGGPVSRCRRRFHGRIMLTPSWRSSASRQGSPISRYGLSVRSQASMS